MPPRYAKPGKQQRTSASLRVARPRAPGDGRGESSKHFQHKLRNAPSPSYLMGSDRKFNCSRDFTLAARIRARESLQTDGTRQCSSRAAGKSILAALARYFSLSLRAEAETCSSSLALRAGVEEVRECRSICWSLSLEVDGQPEHLSQQAFVRLVKRNQSTRAR